MRGMKTLGGLAAAVLIATAAGAIAPSQGADPPEPPGGDGAASPPAGASHVMIELAEAPAVHAFRAAAAGPRASRAAAVRATRESLARIEAAQRGVLDALARGGIAARVIYRVQRAYNGIAASVEAGEIPRIRAIPGVKGVWPLVPKSLDNSTSVPFIGAPRAWVEGIGYTGRGVTVGVIDTGIDYLHAHFGGPGAAADYGANNTTVVGDAPNYPGVKVAGGHDFVGDAYNGQNTPVPDMDPMDCAGHGSHVAGTIAGYGVQSDGSTFTGPYGPGTAFDSLAIGPGVAPGAVLYGLRVFGCTGTTRVVAQAIDWAMDPNDDGDFSDHLDVINMSLGSAFGQPGDVDAVASDNAALAGVIVVASAGNSGDTYYITGSPAASGRALSVAASVDDGLTFPALRVDAPAAIAGPYLAGLAAFGPAPGRPGIIDTALRYDTTTEFTRAGCIDAAGTAPPEWTPGSFAGQVLLIDRGVCGFVAKARNAQLAGAVAMVAVNNVPGDPGRMPGTDPAVTIPSLLVSIAAGATIKAQLPAPGVRVTVAAGQTIRRTELADLVAGFTSRGPSAGASLKPDVAAPGQSISSTQALSGTRALVLSGTSMAAPHMAGTLAILRQLHPAWTVEELKALAMNTALHDLFVNPASTPPKFGAGRVGAGRVDVPAAAAARAVAYADDGSGRVSLSFGVVEALGTVQRSRTIRVVNKSGVALSHTVSYQPVVEPAGVTITPGAAVLNVAAGGSATLTVHLKAEGGMLKHQREASVAATQTTTLGALPRHWLTEAAGSVVLASGDGPPIRVPLHAVVRPAGAMATAETRLDVTAAGGVGSLTLHPTGTPVNNIGAGLPADVVGLVEVLELAEASPEITPGPSRNDSADLRYLGVMSDGATISFGIATWGDWGTPNPQDTTFNVFIDSNRDGTDDFVVFNSNSGSAATPPATATDVFLVQVCRLSPRSCTPGKPINNVPASTYDTVAFNTNVLVLPVEASSIGVSGPFDYRVRTSSRAAGAVDASATHTYDPGHRGINAPGGVLEGVPALYFDRPGGSLAVDYNLAHYRAAASTGLLLLHHHNRAGERAQVIAVNDVAGRPTALDDAYAITGNQPFAAAAPGVLANDSDPDAAPMPLTAVLGAGPAHGVLSLSANGSFGYTPDYGFVGTDSFSYRAADGVHESEAATVSLAVAASSCPIALSPEALPNGRVGALYRQRISANRCAGAPLAFAVSAGALPPGLSLVPAAGILSGSPRRPGKYSFTITVTDRTTAFARSAYTVVITP